MLLNTGGGAFGKPVLSPDSLCGKENVCVLICTPQPKFIIEIKSFLDELKLENYLLEEAVLKNHKKEVLQVYDMLCDKKSKDIYANMLYCRLEGLYPEHDLFTENQYFCWTDFTSKDTGSSFVDCGAYVGDSMERYIWYKDGVVKKIICLEPDKRNFSAIQKRAARLKEEWNLSDAEIQLFPYGVSDVSTEGVVESYSDNNGLGSKITQEVTEGDAIKIVALDDMINEKVDFIKADIESYEYKMLLGAGKTIEKYKPCVAVCIYHNAVDFFSVPLLCRRVMPTANFAVRHHSATLAETVLYAWHTEQSQP